MATLDTGGINGPDPIEVQPERKNHRQQRTYHAARKRLWRKGQEILEIRVKEMDGVQSVDNQLMVSPLASPAARR